MSTTPTEGISIESTLNKLPELLDHFRRIRDRLEAQAEQLKTEVQQLRDSLGNPKDKAEAARLINVDKGTLDAKKAQSDDIDDPMRSINLKLRELREEKMVPLQTLIAEKDACQTEFDEAYKQLQQARQNPETDVRTMQELSGKVGDLRDKFRKLNDVEVQAAQREVDSVQVLMRLREMEGENLRTEISQGEEALSKQSGNYHAFAAKMDELEKVTADLDNVLALIAELEKSGTTLINSKDESEKLCELFINSGNMEISARKALNAAMADILGARDQVLVSIEAHIREVKEVQGSIHARVAAICEIIGELRERDVNWTQMDEWNWDASIQRLADKRCQLDEDNRPDQLEEEQQRLAGNVENDSSTAGALLRAQRELAEVKVGNERLTEEAMEANEQVDTLKEQLQQLARALIGGKGTELSQADIQEAQKIAKKLAALRINKPKDWGRITS